MPEEIKKWRWDDDESNYVFAGVVVDDEKHNSSGNNDQVHDVIQNLMDAANEKPDEVVGHLAAIVYELSLVVSELRVENTKLRKDLDDHEHENAVVVSY